MNISKEIKEFIRNEVESMDSGITTSQERNKQIIDKVKKEFSVVITSDDIYEIAIRAKRSRDAIKELNNEIESKLGYEVKDDHYHFIKDDFLYKLPVEEIDRMFYDYSKHGGNKSGEQMLQDYQLKPEVWHLIKTRLRLYKDSHTVSPYTIENSSEEQIETIVTEATARHIDTVRHKMVKTHELQYKEQANKALKTLSNIDYYLSHLQEFIEKYEPKKVEFTPASINPNYPPLTIAMSDFHFGKKGSVAIEERMGKIRNYILAQPNTEVHIMSLGDLAEAFVEGGMHPGQSESMELYGFELMLKIANVFETFLTDIYESGKKVTFTGIGGNHDRLGRSHSEDQYRTGALICYEFIKRGLSQSEITINILRDSVNSFDFGPNRFIIAHGDDNFTTRKSEDILWKNGDNSKHNIILSGDKHNVKISETKNATNISLPALAGAGEYDKRLDLHSESGFVVIEPNEEGSVDILIKRLK